MATGLGSDIPLGRLGMFILGKLGGRTPLGRELRRTGTLGSLGRVAGISTWRKDGRIVPVKRRSVMKSGGIMRK